MDDTIELTTTGVAHGGYCVARHEGVVVMVAGALPGEVVRAVLTGRRSRVWYARVVDVSTPSPDRVPHVWGLAERSGVGGADLGHVGLAAGRAWKADVIAQQFGRLAHHQVSVAVAAAPGDEARRGLAWRTRATVQIDEAGRPGMYAAKSHRIVPLDGLPLAHEDIQAALAAAAPRPELAGGTLTYVRPSASGLVTVPGPAVVRETVRLGESTWEYEVAAAGFWQVHREAPAVLVGAVLDAVGEAPVADLYAGSGLFTRPLADRYDRVTAVEESVAAVAGLRRNAAGADIHQGDVAAFLRACAPGAYRTIVADPPRAGAGRAVVDQWLRLGPERLVYVACDPAALARDAAWLMAGGYDLTALTAYDLFPYTHHVETVAVFDRGRPRIEMDERGNRHEPTDG